MKIVILGGGVTGLTAAYYLSLKNHEVTVVEKGVRLGGLAGGFKMAHWEWELERTYHHIFKNDEAILALSKEIQFSEFTFKTPITASLFGSNNNYRIFPVDSPKDFLSLPTISLIGKVRAGLTVVFLKVAPFFSWFEKVTAADFLQKTMGREVWMVMWEQLFLKKYGKYADNIITSFIWARIHKRTQQLGYPKGGFQSFVDVLAAKDTEQGVSILNATAVTSVKKNSEGFEVETVGSENSKKTLYADILISTMPYPITCTVMKDVLTEEYVANQSKRKYLSAINLILKTKKPILQGTYWLNVGVPDVPIMCIVQHTNFVDKKRYGNDEICYLGWYVEEESPLLSKNEGEMLTFVLPHLHNIAPTLDETPEVVGLFKAPYAQPIFDRDFTSISRSFTTPTTNVYIANMDMTYPFDRGTNYAVQLGKDVSNLIT